MKRYYIFVFLCLLLGILFLNLSSEVSASTFEEFEEYVNLVVNGKVGATNSLKTACNYFNTNKNSIKNAVNEEDYNSFVLINGDNCYFEMYTGTTNATLTGNVLRTKNFTAAYSFKINYNSIVSQKSGSYLNSISYYGYNSMGLVTGTFPSDLVYNSKYVSLSILDYPNYEPTIPYRIAQAFIGSHYDNITFTLQDVNNTDIDTGLMLQYFSGDSGTNYDIFLTNVENVINGGYYHIKMTYGGYFITSEDFEIKWAVEIPPNVGEITNNSGEITGNINLQPIQDSLVTIDYSINQQGENITNAIIQSNSGDIERDNFWRSTYDSLFAMNSGDTNEIVMLIESYFPSGDMNPISIYDTIFGSYTNEPDDFIIRWEDHPLNITWKSGEVLYSGDFIKAGSMNFSAYCRDYDVLRLIKFWLNTVLTFFLLFGYYKLLYKCFIDILGAASEDIEPEEPPHRPIGFGRG